MKIYLKLKKKPTSLQDLFEKGYSDYGMFVPTYSNPEYTKVQCERARRSFLDLYRIAKTYFPRTTKKEVAYVLLNEISNLCCFYCSTIKKLIFVRDVISDVCEFEARMNGSYTEDWEDEAGLTFNRIKNLSDSYKHQLDV